MTDPCAEIARRFDPDLHRAAMFTGEPLRSGLMVMIAFDVECARALGASDKMIAQMRLQWWQDRVEDALAGRAVDHEVAGPLAALIQSGGLGKRDHLDYFYGWSRMLGEAFSAEDFDAWMTDRYGAWLMLSARCLGLGTVEDQHALRAMGRAMSLSYALRNAVAMGADGMALLPLAGLDRSAVARGETTATAREVIARLVSGAVSDLAEARAQHVSRGMKPLLRLGWRADATLTSAARPDFQLTEARLAGASSGTRRLLRHILLGTW